MIIVMPLWLWMLVAIPLWTLKLTIHTLVLTTRACIWTMRRLLQARSDESQDAPA